MVPVRTYVSSRWVRLRVCVVFWRPLYGGDHGGASPRGGVRLRDFSSSQLAQSHTVAIGLLSLRTGQLLYYGKYVAIANTEVSIALPITSVAILQVNKQHRRHPAFDHNPTKQKRSRLLQALEAHSHERFRTAAANSRINQNLHLTRSEASKQPASNNKQKQVGCWSQSNATRPTASKWRFAQSRIREPQ